MTSGQTGQSSSGLNNDSLAEWDEGRKELGEVGLELVDKLSVAAGVQAKDKRNKDKQKKTSNYEWKSI